VLCSVLLWVEVWGGLAVCCRRGMVFLCGCKGGVSLVSFWGFGFVFVGPFGPVFWCGSYSFGWGLARGGGVVCL